MVNFSDKDKEEMGGEYFELGVHKVKIMLVVFDKTDEKEPREFVDFTVTDEGESKEARVRLWFTTPGAIKYTFNIIRGIFVHNSKEENKAKIREKVDAVKNSEELEKLCELLIGKEAWLEVSEDPERTYQNEAGETKPSINRKLTGYEPTPKKVNVAPAAETAAPANASSTDEDVMADF